MARPEPKIIVEQEVDNGDVWQVLETTATYIITYRGRPVNIRVIIPGLGHTKFKYKRASYSEEGTAIAQVRRYNRNFNTTDFDYIIV